MERNGMEHRPLYIRSGITEWNGVREGDRGKKSHHYLKERNGTERNAMK